MSTLALTAPPLLSVRDLSITVEVNGRPVPAVHDVSFDLYAGRTLGIVGESGCGKSLTALAIMRLLAEPHVRVAAGNITFRKDDLTQMPESAMRHLRGNRIAMVFQEPSSALNPLRRIGDQIAEPIRLHKHASRTAAHEEAIQLLARVGIPGAAERARQYPHQFSGGMKQRAVIAMALACKPDLLVADEPTTALDVTVQAQILSLLAGLQRDLGMALLLISHDLAVVAQTANDLVVMYAGTVFERAPTAEIFARPRHPYTHALLQVMSALHDRTGTVRLREIPGSVPPLGRAVPGCPFAERCDRVTDECRQTLPPLVPASRPGLAGLSDRPGYSHAVRCFHPID